MSLLLDARRVLLEGLVDCSGMSGAATVSADEAVAEYRELRRSPHGWILGRFLCPTSQIEDLAGVLTRTMQPDEVRWGVGATFDEPLGTAALHAAVFDRHMDPAARVVSAEVRAEDAARGGRGAADMVGELGAQLDAASSISNDIVPLIEVVQPPGAWDGAGVDGAVHAIALAATRRLRPAGAHLRLAWRSEPRSPDLDEVASFLGIAARLGVPVKLSLDDPAYLINVVVAAALAWEAEGDDVLVAALGETDPEATTLGVAGLRWRGRRFGVASLAALRSRGLMACGSGNFPELVHILLSRQILQEGGPTA